MKVSNPAPTSPTNPESASAIGFAYRFGSLITGPRSRWLVILAWIVLTGIFSSLPPKLSSLYDENVTSAIGDQESVRASKLLEKEFPDRKGLPAIIVFYNPNGLTEADFAVAQQINNWLSSGAQPKQVGAIISIFTVPQARAELISGNNTTMSMIVSLNISSTSDKNITQSVKDIRKFTDQFDGKGSPLQVKVTGAAGVVADAQVVFEGTDITLLLTTIGLVLVLLIIIYRSPILALLPLVAVGITQQVINGLLSYGVKADLFDVSSMSASIMTILLFGAGTDYTIFLISRYREELHSEHNHMLALRKAFAGVASAILSSAGTVIAALLTLLLGTLGLYYSLGPALAIAVAVMLVAGLTLVPALLAIFGSIAFWPFHPERFRKGQTTPGVSFWSAIARLVRRYPRLAIAGSTLLLGMMALGNLGVNDVYNFLTGFRQPTQSASGYNILAKNFEPGTLAPFNVVIQLKDGENAYQQLEAIDKVTQAVATVPNVAKVTGPTRPDGKTPQIDPATLQKNFAAFPPPMVQAMRSGSGSMTGSNGGAFPSMDARVIGLFAQTFQYISASNSTIRLEVTLKIDPYSIPALDTVNPIREAAKQAVIANGLGDRVYLSGVTPQLDDTRAASDRDKFIIIPLVLVLTGVILGLLLQSIIAPIFLLLVVLLNYFSALGLGAFLFVTIQGDDGLAYGTPLYAFIFLVALGADYTIFLMARVREEAHKMGIIEGTEVALTNTGGVITSAGLILAGTFLVLTILPLRDLYQLGIVIATGILLDTFVVRGFLVPGIVMVIKNVTWWPGKLK
jgi:uncharacterized membrane protein YdfJ with MMPL/SSD domain